MKQHASPFGRDPHANIVAPGLNSSDLSAGPVEPDELREVGVRLVNERASARGGKVGAAGRARILNRRRKGQYIADKTTVGEIKTLRDKRALSSKDKIVRIHPLNVGNRRKDRDRRFSWFRQLDVSLAIGEPSEVEKSLPVRQKPR